MIMIRISALKSLCKELPRLRTFKAVFQEQIQHNKSRSPKETALISVNHKEW